MAFDFLKKRESEAPPDVGREDEYENSLGKASGRKGMAGKKEDLERKGEELNTEGERLSQQINNRGNFAGNASVSNEIARFEFEKINARIEAMNALLLGSNERFSNVSQQIGEIRAMTLANEKSILKSNQDALRAVDIVKEVQPDKLRMDFQRLELKINTIDERLTADKQYAESLMGEFKEIKRKAGIFEGGEAILKLGEEVKKDLVELQKMGAKVKLNADKSEQIFIEIRKGFSENLKMNEIINNLDANYSGVKSMIEKLKIDYSKIVNLEEFSGFKKDIWKKFALAEKAFYEIEKIKQENERLGNFVETILAIEKKNEEDIADIGISLGNDRIKRVSDYENKINALLEVVEDVSTQISNIKKKINVDSPKDLEAAKLAKFSQEPLPNSFNNFSEHAINNTEQKVNLNFEVKDKAFALPLRQVSPLKKSSGFLERENSGHKTEGFGNNTFRNGGNTIHLKAYKKNMRINFEHEMNDLLLEGGRCLVCGNFVNAFKIYEQIRLLYNPNYDRRREVYYKIMRFYENLLKLSKPVNITFQKT